MQNEWVLGSITKNEANGGPMGSGVLKRKKESELGLRVFFFFFLILYHVSSHPSYGFISIQEAKMLVFLIVHQFKPFS